MRAMNPGTGTSGSCHCEQRTPPKRVVLFIKETVIASRRSACVAISTPDRHDSQGSPRDDRASLRAGARPAWQSHHQIATAPKGRLAMTWSDWLRSERGHY